jgi:hypothetical protein
MTKKDFYADIKALHQTIVQEIMNLMNAHGVTEVDFMGSDADGGYVYCYPSDDVDAESMAVMSVSLKDGHLYLDLMRDELVLLGIDTNEAYPTYRADDTCRVKACAGIELVYDSVWQILEQGK